MARCYFLFSPYQLQEGFLLIGIDLYSDLEGMLQLTVFRQHLMRPVRSPDDLEVAPASL
jgi:hypothetical protein